MIGHTVHAVCPDKKSGDKIATAIHDFEGDQTYTEKKGHNFALNYSFDDVKVADYAGLFIPGGRAPEYLRLNEKVLKMVEHFVTSKKPIAAVCHGVQILTAIKGALSGKKSSGYYACGPEVTCAGGKYEKIDVDGALVDGNLVTAVAWPSHPAVLKDFLKLLGTKITL
eukprot:TRINITY_DN64907_c0_g1_i1.p1 TRINITY_DN64907_c0_g1~~TRINITY_DN64907_c0_g1_i1.p1  ORF type:complete len:168 (+),score=1.54 TRINITY_DN64907_c0_g1_i1:113-616(+)